MQEVVALRRYLVGLFADMSKDAVAYVKSVLDAVSVFPVSSEQESKLSTHEWVHRPPVFGLLGM